MTTASRAVFISYASEDAQAALRICEGLTASGIEVWFDRSELRGGDAWDQRIRSRIGSCALFMPLISANTQARLEGYFRREWKLAVSRTDDIADQKPFLVPVVIDDTPDNDAHVPDKFRERQWTRLPGGDVPQEFAQRVRGLLDRPTTAGFESFPAIPRPLTGRRRTPWIGLGVAAGLLLVAVAAALTVLRPQPAAKPDTRPAAAAVVPVGKSIAVLPFIDMSEKRDQEYFADGLSEELIDLLARDSDLRVSARTSSFSFKGKQTTVAEVAKALGVANVLEGSVRKAGETMRITVQLIRASDGYHAWSSSYDRQLKDVFKVQDEIAAAVVTVLTARLSMPSIAPAVRRTTSSEAYDQYLIGRQFVARRTKEGYGRAVLAFQRAIAIDPTYAAAYAGLSDAQYLDAWAAGRLNAEEFSRSQSLLNHAIALAPDLADGYSARGVDRMEFLGDLRGAQDDLSRAISLEPTSSTHQRRYGFLMRCLGNLQEAIRYGKQATETDPLDTFAWVHLGESLLANGQYAPARQAFTRLIEINPEDPYAVTNLLDVDLLEGRTDGLQAAIGALPDPKWRFYYAAMAEFTLGHDLESRKALDTLIEIAQQGEPQYNLVADVYAWRGDVEHSIRWLDKAASRRLGPIACESTNPPYLRLRDNPEFKAFLHRMNLAELPAPQS